MEARDFTIGDVDARWMASLYERIKLDGCLTLSDLWKEKVSLEWDEPCHQVFGELKTKFFLPPVLKFAEFDKPFEVHTGASDFSIGKALM